MGKSLIVQTDSVGLEILSSRHKILDAVEAMHTSSLQWFDCDTPEEYREMRKAGTHGFPKPHCSPDGKTIAIKSRGEHSIQLRVVAPKKKDIKGVFLHFHAGGFVIGSALNYDTYLEELAEALSMAMVSVEYRLAPEHPFPAAHHDCLDAALFALSPTGKSQLGGPVKIIGGESAGGCLTVWVALALRDQHGIDVRSRINALVPSYGMFDMSITPSVWNHKRRALLGKTEIFRFIEAAFGNCHFGDRKSAQVSPLYATLEDMPPALFMVGTEDPLYDDTVFMANRWHLSRNETKLRIWEGVAHAFTLFPMGDATTEGKEELINFIKSNLK